MEGSSWEAVDIEAPGEWPVQATACAKVDILPRNGKGTKEECRRREGTSIGETPFRRGKATGFRAIDQKVSENVDEDLFMKIFAIGKGFQEGWDAVNPQREGESLIFLIYRVLERGTQFRNRSSKRFYLIP